MAENLGTIRTEFGTFGRQISGYSLEHLLPERHFDLARFLAGTEGTLAVIMNATVRLVADAPHKIMIALGYPSMAEAADATPTLLEFRPTAIEGLGRRIVEVVRRQRGDAAVPPLPRGDGWVFVELVGDDPGEIAARAEAMLAASRLPRRLGRRPPGAGAGAVEDPRGRGRSRRGEPVATGVLGVGGRRRPAGSSSAAICGTSTACSTTSACRVCRTGTSATAACTSGSTSR